MPNPSIVQHQSARFASGVNPSITLATNPTPGNFILIGLSVGNATISTAPTELTSLDNLNNGTGIRLATYKWQVPETSDPTYTNTFAWTLSASVNSALVIYEVKDYNVATPIASSGHAIATVASGTTQTAPSVTPDVSGCFAIAIFAFSGSGESTTPQTGWTEDEKQTGGSKDIESQHMNTVTTLSPVNGVCTITVAGVGVATTILIKPGTTLAVSSTEVDFANAGSTAATVNVTGGTAPVTVFDSDPTVALTTILGSTITITPQGVGQETVTVQDDTGATIHINVEVASGTIVAGVSQFQFKSSTDTPQTCTPTEVGYDQTFTVSSSATGVATVAIAAGVVTVTPVAAGTCNITIQDAYGVQLVIPCGVASGTIVATPSSLSFGSKTARAQTVAISETGVIGNPWTASGTGGGLITLSLSGNVLTVTPSGTGFGTANITIGDGLGAGHNITVPVVVVSGNVVMSPLFLTFNTATSPTQTIAVSENGYSGSWTVASLDPTVCTVTVAGSTLTVTPVGPGATQVTATDSFGNVGTTNVTVYGPLQVNPLDINFVQAPNGSTQNITVQETAYTLHQFTAVSSNTAVATVTPANIAGPGPVEFVVHHKGPGTCTITIADNHGNSTIVNVNDTFVALNASPTSVQFASSGASAQNVTIGGGVQPYSVSSSNPAIATATISGNVVTITPVSAGVTQINVTDSNSPGTTIAIQVGVASGTVAVSPPSMTFASPSSGTQTGTASETGFLGTFSWSSTNTGIATVNASTGVVTPVAAGTCNITASDGLGHSANILVTVQSGLITLGTTVMQFASSTSPIQTSTVSETGYSGTYTTPSSNSAVATATYVGSLGSGTVRVTPVGAGSCTITVTDSNSHTAQIVVNVASGSVSVSPNTMAFGGSAFPAQTSIASETGYAGAWTATSSNSAVASATVVGSVVQVTPVGPGTCTITVKDSFLNPATISVTVASGTIVATPASLNFQSPSSPAQTVTLSELYYSGSFSASTGANSPVSVGVVGATLTVTPTGTTGPATVTVTDIYGNTVLIAVFVISPLGFSQSLLMKFTGFIETDSQVLSPFSITKSVELLDMTKQFRFQVYDTLPHPIYGDQTLAYFDPTYNLPNPSLDGRTYVCDGKVFTESSADLVYGASHINVALYVDASGGYSPAQAARTPFATTSTTAITSTGSQTFTVSSGASNIVVGSILAYDSGSNIESVTVTNVSGSNITASFTKTHVSGVAVVQGGLLSNGSLNIVNHVWTGTNYTFNYSNGTATINSTGLTALGYPAGLPPNAVVSVAGNPTYMAPEVMIRKLLVEKAQWSPLFLALDTSNVLLPMYTGEDKALWDCLQEIAASTNPRFAPWMLWADEDGVVHFAENNVDCPPVKTYVDERDIISATYEQTARQLRTVVRADGAVTVASSGDQALSSIAYSIEGINKYSQTEAEQVASNLVLNVRNLSIAQAIAYMNMLTASILAQLDRPTLVLTVEVWPDPSVQIGDKIRVRSKRVGTTRDYIVTGHDEDITPGVYTDKLELTEFYEPVNYYIGLPATIGFGNTQNSTIAPPTTPLIGAVILGSGVGTYAFQYGEFVKNPQTGDQILPVWDLSDGSSMLFDVYLNSMPASGQTANVPTQSSNPGQYSNKNLPPGIMWQKTLIPATGDFGYYGLSPGGTGYPPTGYYIWVGPDGIFYQFNHAPPIISTDTTKWFPSGNLNPATGATQTYTGTTETVYLWQWWYLCLDSTLGVGKKYRLLQRVNASQDAVANSVPASGGLWVNNSWSEPPGMSLTKSSYIYGNMVAGITDYTTPPPGFVGANVMASTPAVNFGVAYGNALSFGSGTYVNYQKKTRGHYCVLAASNSGAVQFLRVPFVVYL